jgi:CheY-like chemotaxis protein
VARIICVEDEPAWLDIVSQALAGHLVDPARTFGEAVTLIQANDYDVALVDLNLEGPDDRLGAEILDLLRLEHPSTRLIVVTAHPPSGGVKANILERYGVDEVILKAATTLPDLRRIVSGVLNGGSPATLPAEVKAARSEVRQRYLDWHGHLERIIRTRAREAEDGAGRAGRKRRPPGGAAGDDRNRWLRLREELVDASSAFERLLSEATEMPDIAAASERLDQMIDEFAGRY